MKERIAVYWDFDNIHISVCSSQLGKKWTDNYENRKKIQPETIDIDAIMDYISSLGEVNINKAYAEWSLFGKYSKSLQNYSIDLIQLFPRGSHMKNGADIRMAIDVVEDMHFHSHIDKIIILGGDSDYIALAQKVRQKGKQIVGIGVKETTNPFLIKACNEFKIYSSLIAKSSGFSKIRIDKQKTDKQKTDDINDVKKLLIKAISALISKTDEEYAKKSAIKPMMIRLDPSFDESNYNFKTFALFLDNFKNIIIIKPEKYDHHIFLKSNKNLSLKADNQKTEKGVLLIDYYRSIVKTQKINLLEPKKLRKFLIKSFDILNGRTMNHENFEDFYDTKKFSIPSIEISKNNVSRIIRLLKRTDALVSIKSKEEHKFELNSSIKSPEELIKHVFNELVIIIKSKLKKNEILNYEIIYNLFYENDSYEDEFAEIVKKNDDLPF